MPPDFFELPEQQPKPRRSLLRGFLKTFFAVLVTLLAFAAVYFAYINWSFGLGGDVAVNGEILEDTKLTGYVSKNPYATSYFKKYLNSDEVLLYDAFEYAYENPNDTIEVKKQYTEEQFNKVLYYLKSDSPMFTVNTIGAQTMLDSTDPLEHYFMKYDLKIPIAKSYRWTKIVVPKTERDNTAKNLSAETMRAAKQIIDAMPKYKTQTEKAEYIYRYLVTHVTYDGSGNIDQGSPVCTLYGALINKRAQCDGFAAANMLLLNMAGIDCFKVFYTGDDIKSDVGHTWNIARLDGNYYNIDASGGENYTKALAKWSKSAGAGTDIVSYEKFAMTTAETKYDSPVINRIFNEVVPECTSVSPRQSLYSLVVTKKNFANLTAEAVRTLKANKKGRGSLISVKFDSKDECQNFYKNFDGGSGYGQSILDQFPNSKDLSVYNSNDVVYLFLR